MSGRLDGKVAVITGAASGIGRESARRFAAEGARVCVVDLADEAGEAVAAEVGGLYLHADVTDEDEVAAMYARAAERWGGIDVLFNNAGIAPPDDVSVLDTGLAAWRRVQEVNLTAVFLCCKHGIPHLLARGGGAVVNTASFVAVMGAATSQISYTASKGGVLALSRELGIEFARRRVRSTRSVQARSTPPCSRSCSPRTRSGPPAAWSTCPWAASPRRPRSPPPPASWPPTTPATSPPARSWSTAACPAPTSHQSRRPGKEACGVLTA